MAVKKGSFEDILASAFIQAEVLMDWSIKQYGKLRYFNYF